MTDHIPADKLREIYDMYRNGDCTLHDAFRDAIALIPPKPLPTLADMTPEEREACVGMWCNAEGYGRVLVLARITGDGTAQATNPQDPYPHTAPLKNFTPRPDLPRAWNPDGTPAPTAETPPAKTADNPIPEVSADLLKSATGQVVAKDICNKEPQPGEAWLIDVAGDKRESVKLDNTNMCWLTVDDTGTTVCYMESEIDLIARLVPETPRKTLATVEDYRNAPARWICLDETADDEGVFYKLEDSLWMDGMGYVHSPVDMSDTPRTVIWEPED